MSSLTYPPEILRLTTTNPFVARLSDPMGSAQKRSPICGSRVTVDINLDEQQRVCEIGMLVQACAYGQAASTILARNAIGRTMKDLAVVRDAFALWLTDGGKQPEWPGIDAIDPKLLNSVRKAAVQLAFEAAAEAAQAATARIPAKASPA